MPSNLDILEQHTMEVLKRVEVGPLEEDPTFCAKVLGKFNKVSTASAAAAAESLEDNHLRLMLVNGRIIRDLRRPGSSPVKTESEPSPVDQSPPKSCVDVKLERTEKAALLGRLERVKNELREEASGHSGVSDVESDSDSPSESKASSSSSSSDDDSESSQEEEERVSSQQTGSGNSIQLDQSGQKLRHKHKPLKRERPTSPSTEEAIQGMLSMAGLLCPSKQEEAPSPPPPQEAWWSGSGQHSLQQAAQHQCRLQGAGKSPMDSQGNSSSEAWDNQGLPSPNPEYQYCDPSMSPPLHPSKRNAPNPPPISNQATKGKRPKKGMATAKQRLGKILKLNRHSRVFV